MSQRPLAARTHRQTIVAPGGADSRGPYARLPQMGATADRLLLPEHPTPVLLVQANDLRFGAVPHLFVRAPAALSLTSSHHTKTASDQNIDIRTSGCDRYRWSNRETASDNLSCIRSAFACQWKSASGARTGMQLVNMSANRPHCQSVPSAALVGDVRLTDSNAATQANIRYAAISRAPLWVVHRAR